MDLPLRNEWKINVGKPNWEPGPHSSVCSLHFRESDYKLKSNDSQERRQKRRLNGMISLKVRLLKPDAVPRIFSKSVPDNQLQSIDNDSIDDHGEFSIDENPMLSPQKGSEITLSEDPDKREETKEFSVKVEDAFSKLVPEDQLQSIDNDSIDDHREFSTEDPDERDETPMLSPQKEDKTDIDFNKTKEFTVKSV